MTVKKVLVGVDDEVWRRVKARSAEEGRAVGLVVENALRLYLGAPTPTVVEFQPVIARNDASVPEWKPTPADFRRGFSKPTVEDLRALVASVPSGEPLTIEPQGRPETALERQRRIAERQAYYRDHPGEEPQ